MANSDFGGNGWGMRNERAKLTDNRERRDELSVAIWIELGEVCVETRRLSLVDPRNGCMGVGGDYGGPVQTTDEGGLSVETGLSGGCDPVEGRIAGGRAQVRFLP